MEGSRSSRRLAGDEPESEGLTDTHKPRSGTLDSLRTVSAADTGEHRSMTTTARSGGNPLPSSLSGARTEVRSLSPMAVQESIPKRTNQYRNTFSTATAGSKGASQHAADHGLGIETKMEILHAKGHGQVGRQGDLDPHNLAAGSYGANTQMIPYDNAVNDHPSVSVTSRHHFFSGTQVAESTTQSFVHPNYKEGREPFFEQSIAADRTPVTREEYADHKARATNLKNYVSELDRAEQSMSFEEVEFNETSRTARKRPLTQTSDNEAVSSESPFKRKKSSSTTRRKGKKRKSLNMTKTNRRKK